MDPGVRIVTLKNGYKIWTRTSQQGTIPVLMLHGGPGFNHKHLEYFESWLASRDYQAIFYDQLGSRNSDKPDDASLWTIERFTEEVEEIRLALGLDDFIIFGYSWGGALAIEYALKYQQHLQELVISNMSASFADYEKRMSNIRQTFPQEVLAQLTSFEQTNDLLNPSYRALIQTWLYEKYFCRLSPWPALLLEEFEQLNQKVYGHLFGYNDFKLDGTVQSWNRWQDLKKITVPTLIMGARYDIFDPQDLQHMSQLIPGAQFFESKIGSHFAYLEDSESYFDALLGFLNKDCKNL